MRVARTSPLCVAGRGEDRLLHLYRRLVQPGATAFCPRLPLAHGLRTGDGGPTNGSVINQARQHSTKTGQLQSQGTQFSSGGPPEILPVAFRRGGPAVFWNAGIGAGGDPSEFEISGQWVLRKVLNFSETFVT